jgi:hypothetical protein
MQMVDRRKLEVLKVFYAVFTTLMDDPEMPPADLLSKLRMLNARLKNEVLERGSLN